MDSVMSTPCVPGMVFGAFHLLPYLRLLAALQGQLSCPYSTDEKNEAGREQSWDLSRGLSASKARALPATL